MEEVKGIKLLLLKVQDEDTQSLKNILDTLANKYDNIFMLVANQVGSTLTFVARSNSSVDASGIIKKVTSLTLGNGGGSPKFAQGSGKDASKLDLAFEEIKNGI